MSRFTTRVQLGGSPTAEEYEKLHRAMKGKGFSRIITSDNGDHYWLPNAEYDRICNLTRLQVLNEAKAAAAAATVKASYEVLVTEGGCSFFGLQKATADQKKAS